LGGYDEREYEAMARLRIGLLNKKRGNFAIQEKFIGADNVVDETDAEVEHHERVLTEAGYNIRQIRWGPNFINDLQAFQIDLVFNVSSLVEAAILEELEIPYVGSDTFTIASATDKSLAKRLWQQACLENLGEGEAAPELAVSTSVLKLYCPNCS
jgi:D-alanine-D-alanine ligase